MHILSYVDFEKLCNVRKQFSVLNCNFVKEDITIPLSYSSRAVQWRKIYWLIRNMCGKNWYINVSWLHYW